MSLPRTLVAATAKVVGGAATTLSPARSAVPEIPDAHFIVTASVSRSRLLRASSWPNALDSN